MATIDSTVYRNTFYGILNAQGGFWSPVPFESEDAARECIGSHWKSDRQGREWALANFKVVPVRIKLNTLDPTPIAHEETR